MDCGKNCDSIYGLQETYITNPGEIRYIWRGNFHLTPGRGNSLGCLTLLSNHLNIVAKWDFEERGHILACQKLGDLMVSYIVCNLYSPNPHNREKIDFYERVFDLILEFEQTYACSSILVFGDFNLIF